MEVVAENVVVPQQKIKRKQKFTDTLYFYRTYNENEYINRDGDIMYKFEKITDEKVYFNSTSFCKFEDDHCNCCCSCCNSRHNKDWIGCEICDVDFCKRCKKYTHVRAFIHDKIDYNKWKTLPNNSKNSKWFKIIKKCVNKDLFVIHHEEINSLTLKTSSYKIIFHNSPYIFYQRNYKDFNDSGFYDDM